MLRKTNYNRDSLKRTDIIRRFSLTKSSTPTYGNNVDDATEMTLGGLSKSVDSIYERKVMEELFPGVVLEGIEVDL